MRCQPQVRRATDLIHFTSRTRLRYIPQWPASRQAGRWTAALDTAKRALQAGEDGDCSTADVLLSKTWRKMLAARRGQWDLGSPAPVSDFWLSVLASVVGGAIIATVLIASDQKIVAV